MAAVLVLARLCEPSSELHIAETWYRGTAPEDLLALPAPLVNDDRLYRALDRLVAHKTALEQHLVARLWELFALDYDLLLYDVTRRGWSDLRLRCVVRPEAAQAALLDRLGLDLPQRLRVPPPVAKIAEV
jgi:hypothetical protein